ncbi:trehalose-phosphatase [Phreatobacter sp.]|uniref:trehalose-phosphatase n=1 Tax=Phreatobacter sp. TaxID=1966341 RepID=UPI003F71930A
MTLPGTDPNPVALAVFLDIDGTLLEFAETPDAVLVPDGLPDLLMRMQDHLDGALALVSGRTIDWIDETFAPARLACAGEHGAAWRLSAEGTVERNEPPTWLSRLNGEATQTIEAWPGIVVERKPSSLAIHYRRSPDLAGRVEAAVAEIVADLGPTVELLRGNHVLELRMQGASKGSAVERFMAVPPFEGRVPVMIGDDVTDEDGFRAARALGGLAIGVGPRESALANRHLRDPVAVRAWLAAMTRGSDVQTGTSDVREAATPTMEVR